jgi:hypothetical protein
MNNIAFLIPVYPPHYNYLDFLNILDKQVDFDIVLILSYKSDLVELQKLDYKNYNTIVLEDYFSESFISLIMNKNIITFKKYFALKILQSKYIYCAVVDCEIEFVNTNNVYDKFKTFIENKKIIGSVVKNERKNVSDNINRSSSIYFQNNEENYNKLIELTHNFEFYFWFSDIPIYDMSFINEFFDFIHFNDDYDNFINNLNWAIFDYIPYAYFVVLFKNYSFLNVNDFGLHINWSLESLPIETYNNVIKYVDYHPLWVIYNTYLENKNNEFIKNDIIITYHKNDGRYHYF